MCFGIQESQHPRHIGVVSLLVPGSQDVQPRELPNHDEVIMAWGFDLIKLWYRVRHVKLNFVGLNSAFTKGFVSCSWLCGSCVCVCFFICCFHTEVLPFKPSLSSYVMQKHSPILYKSLSVQGTVSSSTFNHSIQPCKAINFQLCFFVSLGLCLAARERFLAFQDLLHQIRYHMRHCLTRMVGWRLNSFLPISWLDVVVRSSHEIDLSKE